MGKRNRLLRSNLSTRERDLISAKRLPYGTRSGIGELFCLIGAYIANVDIANLNIPSLNNFIYENLGITFIKSRLCEQGFIRSRDHYRHLARSFLQIVVSYDAKIIIKAVMEYIHEQHPLADYVTKFILPEWKKAENRIELKELMELHNDFLSRRSLSAEPTASDAAKILIAVKNIEGLDF